MLLDKREEELNVSILRLTYACPVGQKNRNCPLREVRKNDFAARSNWVNWLSFIEKQDIFQRHETCMYRHQPKS